MGEPALEPPGVAMPTLWRAADVAHFYGVDESTVHRWERAGRIRRSRRDPGGKKYWIRREVIADALDMQPPGMEAVPVVAADDLVAATRKTRRRR
ncbi:MAG: MerR family DNA-binding transcriptional regulator [Actinomycetota bacterium]|nr:MerR family DNA-binding transcriptional regulator [Actinomycetota bacterium]